MSRDFRKITARKLPNGLLFPTRDQAGVEIASATRAAASRTALRVSSSRAGVMRTMGVERLMAETTGWPSARMAAAKQTPPEDGLLAVAGYAGLADIL